MLAPVDGCHAPVVFLVRVCPMHEQVLNDAGLVVVGGVEKAGPPGLSVSHIRKGFCYMAMAAECFTTRGSSCGRVILRELTHVVYGVLRRSFSRAEVKKPGALQQTERVLTSLWMRSTNDRVRVACSAHVCSVKFAC